jgi:hypothetical protein
MKIPYSTLRIIGSSLLVIGYFVMLNIDVFWGVVLRFFANALSFPWALKNKVWDFVILLGFFMVIEFFTFVKMVGGS